MSTPSFDIKFTQRFPANLISNITFFALNIIIGLLLVPYFLDKLGTAAYGLIPLATSATSYITFIIDSLNTSVSRYLTIDLQREDQQRANETYNTAIFGTLGVILLLVPVAFAAAWYAPVFFNIGDQSATDVFLLFSLIFSSVLIRAWSSNFMATLFAYNRLDLRNYINSVNLFVQLILVVTLFLALGPSLVLVGISYLGAAIATLVMAFILSGRICPSLKISPAFFMRSRFMEIGGMSTWVLINSISLLLNTQVALIMVNKFFGSVAGTEYSLAAVWSTLLVGISGLITSLFTPMIYSYYAKNDREGIIRFTSMTIRIVGLFMALPITLVCIFSAQLLTFWVGAKFAHLTPLVWICVAPVILQIMVSCISPITVTHNRIRSLVILTLPMGVLNVVLAILFYYILDIGMYGVALAGVITLVLRYGLINPLFIAHVIEIPWWTYLAQMLYGVGGMLALSASGIVLFSVVTITTLPMLILASCVLSSGYLLFVLRIMLKPEERQMIRSCLPGFCQAGVPPWLL